MRERARIVLIGWLVVSALLIGMWAWDAHQQNLRQPVVEAKGE
jgi:hypothetical protein